MIDPYPYEWPLTTPKNVACTPCALCPWTIPLTSSTLIVKWDGENWLDQKFGSTPTSTTSPPTS